MANNFKKRSLILAMGVALSASPLYAAEEEQTEDEAQQKMVIVGSRAAPRSIGDSPVPVDVISADEIMKNGNTDMTSLLATVAPSFNVNEQPISDAATLVRPANLRGLPPDSTLILVNGKRRHRSAVISFLGGGISDGSQGPDISVIPAIALKQIEVLRDGASAQYGSDAIAGVINFVLKDDDSGGEFEAKLGEYAEGDGDTMIFAGNVGVPFTERGFANFSYEYSDRDDTSRSVQRDDAAGLIAAGNTAVADPAQIWGSPKVSDDIKFFANIGLQLTDKSEFYMFGNLAEREVDGGFFFRNPNTRGGVFRGPEVGGLPTILTGDLTPGATDNSACPVVQIVNGVPDAAALASLDAANCFAFNNFPGLSGGFTPRFGGTVVDSSIAMGTKGEYESGMIYDFSISLGRNAVDFAIRNTLNPSMGPSSPTEFSPGSYVQLEKSVAYDISKEIEADSVDLLTVSAGVEWREESFEVKPGDPASFEIGPLAAQGFGIGSNGFAGFKPSAGGVFSRRNIGTYIDIESYLNEQWMLDFALRYEDFSDFGSTTDWKLSTHYQATDAFALRGSVSTGFRAPTTGQSNVSNVTTAFVGTELQDQATLPPTNPISVQKGGTPLTPEESNSFTFGAIWEADDLFVTVDFFQIEVTDRISQTSPLELDQTDIDALLAQGVLDASSFSSVVYFTNDFDTTTTGIDLVVSYSMQMWGGETDFNFAFNRTKTEVDAFNPDIINATKVRQLEGSVPQNRGTITMNHSQDKWNLMARLNYYGDYYEAHLDNGDWPIYPGAEITLDSEFGYYITDSIRLALGAQNLTDNVPDNNPWAGIAGAQYPVTSPMGFNGRFTYAKLNYTF